MKFKSGDKVRFLGKEACANSKYISAKTICLEWMGLVEGREYVVTNPNTGYNTPPTQTYIKINKLPENGVGDDCYHLPEDVFELVTSPEEEFNIHDEHKALRYNTGKPKVTLIHNASLEPMVRVLEFGAQKYAPYNWTKGFDKLELLDCLKRHVDELIDKVNTGQSELDGESGQHIIGHIMCNAMFYSYHFVINKDHARDIRETELN